MSANKEQEILEYAIKLFRDKGYHATSMQDLADAVGLQKGSLYHYISSKEDLLMKIIDRAMRALMVKAAAIDREKLEPTEKLHRAIQEQIEAVASNLGSLTVFIRETHALTPEQKDVIWTARRRYRELYGSIINEGISSGIFREVDPHLVSLALFGMGNSIYQWYKEDGRLSASEIGRAFADLLVNGIRKGEG